MTDPEPIVVPLREYIESRLVDMDLRYQQRFDAQQKALEAALLAQEKAVQTAMIAAEKAVSKAEIAQEKRNEATNEFRGQLSDQAATFMPRIEAEQRIAQNREMIDELRQRDSVRVGTNNGAQALWGYLVAAIGVAIAIATFALR